jgi:type I restriction enzyme S subunit
MRSDWNLCKLGDVIEVNPYPELNAEEKVVYVGMADLRENARKIDSCELREYPGSGSRFQNNDTLLARITPCLENGKTAYVDLLSTDNAIAWGSTEFIVLRARPNITDALFVYYLARHPNFRDYAIQRMEGTSGRQRVPTISVEQYQFLLPPLPEQRAIAEILGSLDDKIELNRQMNATLEAIARAIFTSWFVDFDPVHAKARGEAPAGMDAATAALFPDAFVDSELGPIPAGWEVRPFSEVIKIITGGTPRTSVSEYWDGGSIPWFSVKDTPAPSNIFVIDTERKVTQAGIENSSAKMLPVGTTIISARGTVGKLAMVGIPMSMNQSCYGIRDAIGEFDYYNYFHLKSVVAKLQQRTHGSVFDTITKRTFKTIQVVMPTMELMQAFEALVNPLLDHVRANVLESQTLADLRDTLLPKLISGELRVPEKIRQD